MSTPVAGASLCMQPTNSNLFSTSNLRLSIVFLLVSVFVVVVVVVAVVVIVIVVFVFVFVFEASLQTQLTTSTLLVDINLKLSQLDILFAKTQKHSTKAILAKYLFRMSVVYPAQQSADMVLLGTLAT